MNKYRLQHEIKTGIIYNLLCLYGVSVCPFVSNKRQNGLADRAQISCGISRDPREGLWVIKNLKTCLQQNSIFKSFENPQILFRKSAKFVVFVLYCIQRENVNS